MTRRNTGQGGAACRPGLFCACKMCWYLPHDRRATIPIPYADCAAARKLPLDSAAEDSHAEQARGGRFLARARLPAWPQPPSRVFNRLRRRYAPLTGTNPRWCGAQMRQKTGSPPRRCTGRTEVTPSFNLYTVRACALIVRRPVKARLRLALVLTGRHRHRHDVAHRARHHQKEEPV